MQINFELLHIFKPFRCQIMSLKKTKQSMFIYFFSNALFIDFWPQVKVFRLLKFIQKINPLIFQHVLRILFLFQIFNIIEYSFILLWGELLGVIIQIGVLLVSFFTVNLLLYY